MFDAGDNREEAAIDEAVFKEVANHSDGITARALMGSMQEQFSRRNLQTSIHRTVDSGRLKLGSMLELRVSKTAG